MTKTEFVEKLKKTENAQELLNEIQNAETDEKVLEILKQHGVDLDPAELQEMLAAEEDLDEELLETVVGGCKCGWLRKVIVWGVNCILAAAGVETRMQCH